MRRGHILTIEDMRRAARRCVPRMFFGYVDSGSWTESTRDRNQSDFSRIQFRQRVAVDISRRKLAVDLLGRRYAMPIALAPTGMAGMLYPNAEIEIAKAAGSADIPYTLSTMSICSMEAVAEAVDNPFWFQLYVMRDRTFVRALIERARAVQCSALMITLDLQVLGQRHADIRNSLAAPPRASLSSAIQILSRPLWMARMLRARHVNFGNIYGHVPGINNLADMAGWTQRQFDPTLTWEGVREIRDQWQGPLILKGILDPDDAELAKGIGADAIVVSNHGGRQLDGAPSTISALPEIVDRVGGSLEVHIDGGIRSGQDVARAMASGARAAHIGRPFLYGAAVAGKNGVSQVLEILRSELDLTMAFCGETDATALSTRNLIADRSAVDSSREADHAAE